MNALARAALREAVLNAIVHRDYSTGAPIQIKVFPDHLVIYSDGGLPPTWTLEKLLGHHDSAPRNPNIANTFFRSGQIETRGRGIEKIEEASRKAYKPAPIFEVTAAEVNVTFFFSDTVGFSSPHGDESGVDNGDEVARNNNVAKLLVAIAATPAGTQKRFAEDTGLSTRTISREIKKLREAGILRRVGSDKQGHWVIENGKIE